MKKFIIDKSLETVSSIYPEYDEVKLSEIRYGLEAIYLSLTKVIVILSITLLLGIFKEAILLLLLFNGLRITAFGIHASKSWMCWLSSSILFIGFPYLCIYLQIPLYVHYVIIIFSILCFFLYAPADTKKRPLVRKNRRTKFNTKSMLLQNMITCSMLIESVLIHPFTYRIFHLPYKNYERYVFSK